MFISPYTILFNRNGKYYAFSTLTKTFLEMDKKTYDALSSDLESIKETGAIENSDIRFLYDSHILCDNPKDEYLICKSMILDRRNDETDMHLTIAPTMDCCFSCYYCFERNKKPTYMSYKTVDAIIKLICHFKAIKHLHVTWFGGEPLMAVDVIDYFSTKIISTFKGHYSADIITTAFHINEKVIDVLKRSHITEMQISIDGKENSHNAIKFTSSGENSFRKIMDNILLLSNKYPSLNIGVRVNLTKQNYEEYTDLYYDFSKRFTGRKISIFPGFVVSRNNGIESKCLFSRNEVSLFSLNLWNMHKIPTPWIIYQKEQSECAIRKKNSLVVDASGNVYKCWEKLGDEKHKIGKLSQDGQLTRYLYGADILDDEKCRECSMLPICFGGCPILRLENVYEKKRNILCSSYKGKIEQWLSAYIELKEYMEANNGKESV